MAAVKMMKVGRGLSDGETAISQLWKEIFVKVQPRRKLPGEHGKDLWKYFRIGFNREF